MNRLGTLLRHPIVAGLILLVVVLSIRSVKEAWSAWDRGTVALVEYGDRKGRFFVRTAPGGLFPGFLPREATEKILELASEDLSTCEQCVEGWTEGEDKEAIPACPSCSLAVYGFDSGRAGILMRSFYTPNEDLLEPLNGGLVRALVLAAEVDPRSAGSDTREIRTARHWEQMRADPLPHCLHWALSWVFSCGWRALRASGCGEHGIRRMTRDGKSQPR